jgi:DeoR/GlpR family transcriptional regulator of sugar metabolism
MNGETPPRLTARQKRILRNAQSGTPPVMIAARFGSSPEAIRRELRRLRQAGVEVERFTGNARAPSTVLRLHRSKLTVLRRDAKRRGLSVRELAERIIAQVIKRGLVADLVDGGADERQ